MRTVETDVLIVGGGGAALRAAVAASDAGAHTTVAIKGARGRSGATVSPDSTGVAWQAADECAGGEDSPDIHFRNIVDTGLGMADPRLSRILADEVLERGDELEQWGMSFIPDPEGKKRHYSGYSCFGDQPRAHGIANSGWGHAGDIVKTLVAQMQRRDIPVHENVFITDLIVVGGECRGALGLLPDGDLILYRSGAVVVVAGGARQIFPVPPGRTRIDTTGDGYAMALRAGAELANMEFMQYMLAPVNPFPVSCPGSFWSLFPTMRNSVGEDALARYLPPEADPRQAMYERTLHYPFSSRDTSKWIDIAITTEVREGRGTPEGGLYLDFSSVDLAQFEPSRPQHLPEDRQEPVVLPAGMVQIRSHAHAINGGVLINERTASTLPGLFAAGEVAAGAHGADRLGGGMVTNCQVFGARAGRFAAEYALGTASRNVAEDVLEAPLAHLQAFGRGDRNAEEIFAALQEAASADLVVTRNERSLTRFLARVRELAGTDLPRLAARDGLSLRLAIEAENSLLTGELMAMAALMRRESRGSHRREEYPEQDDARWRVSIIFRLEDGQLTSHTRSLEQQ